MVSKYRGSISDAGGYAQMTKYKFLLIGLLFISCSVIGSTLVKVVDLDLTKMPQYNMEEATAKYETIAKLQLKYNMLNQVSYQIRQNEIPVTQGQKDKILVAIDKYLYWSSVATIQLFYQKYQESNESSQKSDDGLNDYKAVIIEIAEANRV
jgi:hypothetical protein